VLVRRGCCAGRANAEKGKSVGAVRAGSRSGFTVAFRAYMLTRPCPQPSTASTREIRRCGAHGFCTDGVMCQDYAEGGGGPRAVLGTRGTAGHRKTSKSVGSARHAPRGAGSAYVELADVLAVARAPPSVSVDAELGVVVVRAEDEVSIVLTALDTNRADEGELARACGRKEVPGPTHREVNHLKHTTTVSTRGPAARTHGKGQSATLNSIESDLGKDVVVETFGAAFAESQLSAKDRHGTKVDSGCEIST
jgi:hypothetical protein